MVHSLYPRPAGLELEGLNRELPRGGQIARSMFVVNGERLGGFLRQPRRTAAHREQPPPAVCRVGITPLATAEHGVSSERLDVRQDVGLEVNGPGEAGPCFVEEAPALIQTAQTKRLAGGAGCRRALVQ